MPQERGGTQPNGSGDRGMERVFVVRDTNFMFIGCPRCRKSSSQRRIWYTKHMITEEVGSGGCQLAICLEGRTGRRAGRNLGRDRLSGQRGTIDVLVALTIVFILTAFGIRRSAKETTRSCPALRHHCQRQRDERESQLRGRSLTMSLSRKLDTGT